MRCSEKPRILLQFHITGKCNLRCKHCYRTEGDVQPLSFDDVISVFEQFKELRVRFNKKHNSQRKAHINLTGGEPFFREDIKEILKYLGENKEYFTYGILSNGSFIDDEIIALLKETEVSFLQLSIDGMRATHDALRAKGDYDRVFSTAEKLENMGIKTYISFTANKENIAELPKIARECRKRGITKLWTDRLVPIGNGAELESLKITEAEMPLYLKNIKKARGGRITSLLYPKTQVAANRALQFLCVGDTYSCSAAKSLITVDEFGNIMPCRRMPIPCGDVLTEGLCKVYFENETFIALREERTPKECGNCIYRSFCGGGARCQSYAVYGSFYRADPACFLKEGKKD